MPLQPEYRQIYAEAEFRTSVRIDMLRRFLAGAGNKPKYSLRAAPQCRLVMSHSTRPRPSTRRRRLRPMPRAGARFLAKRHRNYNRWAGPWPISARRMGASSRTRASRPAAASTCRRTADVARRCPHRPRHARPARSRQPLISDGFAPSMPPPSAGAYRVDEADGGGAVFATEARWASFGVSSMSSARLGHDGQMSGASILGADVDGRNVFEGRRKRRRPERRR